MRIPSTPPRRKKITIHAQYSHDIIGSSAASLVFVHENWTQSIMENYNSHFMRPAGHLIESSEVWQLMFISPTMLLREKSFQEYLEQSVDLDVVSKAHAIFPDAKVQVGPLITRLRKKWFPRVEKWPKVLENAEQDGYKVLIIIEIPTKSSEKKGYTSNIDAGLPLGKMETKLKTRLKKEYEMQLFHGHNTCVQFEYAQELRNTAIREVKEETHIDLSDLAECQQDLWPRWFHSQLSLGMSKAYAFGASLHTFFIPKKGIVSEIVNEDLQIVHWKQAEECIENVPIMHFRRSALNPTASVFTPTPQIKVEERCENPQSKNISSHGIDQLLLSSMSYGIAPKTTFIPVNRPIIYQPLQVRPSIVYSQPQFSMRPPILSPNHIFQSENNEIMKGNTSQQEILMQQIPPTAFITLDDLIATKQEAAQLQHKENRRKERRSKQIQEQKANGRRKKPPPGYSSNRMTQKQMPCSEPSLNIAYIDLSDLMSRSSDPIEQKSMDKNIKRPPGIQSKPAQSNQKEYACLGIGCKYVFRDWEETREHMQLCNSVMPICNIAMPEGKPSSKASEEKAMDYRSRNVYSYFQM